MFGEKHRQRIAELEAQLAEQQALRSALDRSQAIVELTPDGVVIDANANFCQIMGYDATELRGQPHRLLCDPVFVASPDYRAFWDSLRRGEFFRGTIRRRHRDGRDIWLEATYNPVLDAAGRVLKVVKFATDVTAQAVDAAAQRAMIESIERSMAVIEFRPDGTILRANENFCRTMGYAENEIVGRHHRLFCQDEFVRGPEYAEFWARLARGEFHRGEFRRRTGSGWNGDCSACSCDLKQPVLITSGTRKAPGLRRSGVFYCRVSAYACSSR